MIRYLSVSGGSERLLRVSRQPNGQPEIFHSIQGEGIYAGRPAIFLRLALCNLACVWCDTKYTWDWEHYDQEKEIMAISIYDAERKIRSFNCRNMVVTGGEPLIQQRLLTYLLKRLKSSGFWIEVETNGTIVPGKGLLTLVDHWSVSPKLENSGNSAFSREKRQAYRLFRELSTSHFKFVVEEMDDLMEIRNIAKRYGLPVDKIVLMPQAQDGETLIKRSRWLVELCMKEGYTFSTRLQVLLWGNRRGI